MESNKVKLLDNYQLFQLAKNERLDEETLKKVHRELGIRNISTIEQKQLERQYNATFAKTNEELTTSSWHPFYTAFAWKRHFRNIALLKTLKGKKEAKAYQIQFYAGMFVYALLFILLILLFAK